MIKRALERSTLKIFQYIRQSENLKKHILTFPKSGLIVFLQLETPTGLVQFKFKQTHPF